MVGQGDNGPFQRDMLLAVNVDAREERLCSVLRQRAQRGMCRSERHLAELQELAGAELRERWGEAPF